MSGYKTKDMKNVWRKEDHTEVFEEAASAIIEDLEDERKMGEVPDLPPYTK